MILVLGASLLWAAPAYAVTVAIVAPPRPTPEWTEALSRLRGELLSVGFEVKLVNRAEGHVPNDPDSRAWLEEIGAGGRTEAVIDVVGDSAPVAVDIWVLERSPRRWAVSRVTHEPNTRNAPERLAIRAVEVLRSTFLANEMEARQRHDESRATVPPDEFDSPPEHRRTFGVEVGAAALTSLDGVGPALLPTLRLDWEVRPWLVAQAALAGLGSRPTVATTAGHARVAQQYGILGGCFRFRPDQRVWPFFALSAGVLHTAVEGQAESPRQGHIEDRWSFLLDGGLGAGLHLQDRYTLTLAAHVQLAEPYVAIHFVDTTVATTGRPNLVLTLTVGVWP
jgi:hypothetical protein